MGDGSTGSGTGHPIGRTAAAWRRFADRRAAAVLLCAWAVGESTIWPVPADLLLAALVLARPRRWPVLATACVTGMALGALLALPLARAAPGTALQVVQAVPGVTAAGLERARALLADHGAPALLLQPVTGVPFKAWAAVVGAGDLPLTVAIPVAVAGRAVRMTAVAVLAAGIARAVGRRPLYGPDGHHPS